MTCKELLKLFETWPGNLGNEDGFKHGNPENTISEITVCWMATVDIIRYAVAAGHNLIIAHEDLLFPPGYAWGYSKENPGLVSRKRFELLAAHDISIIRLHSSLDKLCVLDSFGSILKLGDPVVREDYFRVYEVSSTSLHRFAEHVKKHLSIPHVRCVGDLSHKVHRVGGLWGGLGLSCNASFIDAILRYKVDTVIAGEMDEYAMRGLLDLGIGAVEVGHEVSETIGLKSFAEMLGEKLKMIRVQYQANTYPWLQL